MLACVCTQKHLFKVKRFFIEILKHVIDVSYRVTITHEGPHQCRSSVEYCHLIFVNNVPTSPSIRIIRSLHSSWYQIWSKVFLSNSLTLIIFYLWTQWTNIMMLLEIKVPLFINHVHKLLLKYVAETICVSLKLSMRESK